MKKYLRPNEVAELLEMHPSTVRRWRLDGIGPVALKMPNGHHRYPRAEFEQWFNENMQVSA